MDWTYEINMLMAAYLQLQKIMAVIILRINEEERFEHPAPGKEAAHMAYSERIKNFGRIRDCLRQFQVCGFKSRTELNPTKKQILSGDRKGLLFCVLRL